MADVWLKLAVYYPHDGEGPVEVLKYQAKLPIVPRVGTDVDIRGLDEPVEVVARRISIGQFNAAIVLKLQDVMFDSAKEGAEAVAMLCNNGWIVE